MQRVNEGIALKHHQIQIHPPNILASPIPDDQYRGSQWNCLKIKLIELEKSGKNDKALPSADDIKTPTYLLHFYQQQLINGIDC